jgi:hypothetical protein
MQLSLGYPLRAVRKEVSELNVDGCVLHKNFRLELNVCADALVAGIVFVQCKLKVHV